MCVMLVTPKLLAHSRKTAGCFGVPQHDDGLFTWDNLRVQHRTRAARHPILSFEKIDSDTRSRKTRSGSYATFLSKPR